MLNMLQEIGTQPSTSHTHLPPDIDMEDAEWVDEADTGIQYDIQDVLDGSIAAGFSHEGGELVELMRYYLTERSKQRCMPLLLSSTRTELNGLQLPS